MTTDAVVLAIAFALGVLTGLAVCSLAWRLSLRRSAGRHHRWPFGPTRR